jgi:LysM repeat protein
MGRKIILLAFLFAIMLGVSAQEYAVQGVTPNLHLTHKVSAKETWYSIGRMYNLAPKDIASYNKLNLAKALEIGQQVEVPLTANNFSQNDEKSNAAAFVPVYHIVQPKEWLYRISVNYNKVPVETLQKWNSVGKDGAKPGTKLIVGYLKVKDANATLVTKATAPVEEKTAEVKPVLPVKKEVPQKAEPVVETKPVEAGAKAAAGKNVGYFGGQFEDNGKSTSGVTGIFKSTSGWKDGKYYALVSNVPVGTIIRVTYPATNKTIYAKVLGELPEMKESAGLSLRISDAAAYELGSPESKFSVEMKY